MLPIILAAPAAPETDVLVEEEVDEHTDDDEALPWRVVLYNDEIHTFDEVIRQIIKATGCTTSHAERLTLEVHYRGKAVVYEGDFEDCLRVQSILREIGLITEIQG